MQNKKTHSSKSVMGRFLIALILADTLALSADNAAKKTYRDYPEWELLPKAIDCEDEKYEKAYQRLIDEGESRHEGLLAIVRECEDMQLACRALSILRLSSGDKRDVVAGLKEILATRLSTAKGDAEWVMTDIADALTDMGDEADMEALVPMVSHPVLRVRIIGAWCMGKRGGPQAKAALEEALTRDRHPRVQEEFGKAIAAIESRLAEKDAETPPAP